MSMQRRKSMHALARRLRQAKGFSLIELMIAMVLGLLVMGAAFAVFMSNQNTYRANEGLNRIQESARTSVELMTRDIRSAGASACSNLSTMQTTDTDSVNLDRTPVFGNGTEMTVVTGSELAYAAESVTASSITLSADDLGAASDAFSAGDVLVLCDAHQTSLVRATTVTGLTVNYTPAVTFHYPVTVMLGRYRSSNWDVGTNVRGSSLYVSRAAGAEDEVAEGVTGVAFSYMDQDGVFTNAPADWSQIVAVRMVMTLQAQNNVDGRALQRTASSVVNLRGRSL